MPRWRSPSRGSARSACRRGFAAGGGVAVQLGIMGLQFWWRPFHPVGYVIANSWGMHCQLSVFLFAWAAKSLVIRFGGLRLYRATVPLAIGLIIGNALNQAVWVVFSLLTQGQG